MIIDDPSHEVKGIHAPVSLPRTTLPATYSGLPPPVYDSTVPLLGKRHRTRRNIIPFACWFAVSLVVLAALVDVLIVPQLRKTARFPFGDPSSHSTGLPTPNQPSLTRPSIEPLPTSPPYSSSCVSARDWTRHGSVSSITVQLPLDAEILRFDKWGSHAAGAISFVSSPSNSEDFIDVEILASHLDRAIVDRAGMCVRRAGVHGVTLFTNISDTFPAIPVKFDMRFYLPGPPTHMASFPRQYRRLETDLIDFRHEVQLPVEHVRFQSVKLRSGMARVSVPALAADDIDIKTTQYPIDGNFDTGSALALETVLSHIDVTAKLHARHDGGITSMNLQTTEGPTLVQVDCLLDQTQLGNFTINSSTSNASSSMIVNSLPFGAALNIDTRSTAERVLVQVPLTYEGSFDIISYDAPDINDPRTTLETRDPDAWDPQGLGRRRGFELNFVGLQVQGTVMWTTLLGQKRRRPDNMITMRTTQNALTHLIL